MSSNLESATSSAHSVGKLLQGRVALITGAARGIGWAIAQAMASEGARVALNDLGCDRAGNGRDQLVVEQAAEQLRATGAEVWASHADVRDAEEVNAMLDEATERLGPVDVLINNAGIVADKSLFDMTEQAWDSVLATHLRGTFLCIQAMARRLKKARLSGSIINLTSTSGLLGNVGQLNESTAKAGIYGLTRTASIELQKYRIRVNALSAIAKTRLTEDLPMFEKVGDGMAPEHIAPAAVFLASLLSEDLSGTVLSVAGGRISTFELVESQGRLKEADGGLWTPAEIAQHYDSISRR